MKSRKSRLFIATLILISFNLSGISYSALATGLNSVTSPFISSQDNDSFSTPSFPEPFDYQIDIIFLGIDETRINQNKLLQALPSWYAPVDGMFDGIIPHYDMNFSLSYNFRFSNQVDILGYKEFLDANTKEYRSPFFLQPEYPMARYIHSSVVEDYLEEYLVMDSTPTLVIIDTYTSNPEQHLPYFYNSSYNELDAELEGWTLNPVPWSSTYQIAGGGKDSRLLWLDLSAGPTVYHSTKDDPTGGVEEVRHISEYDESSNAQLTEDLVKYIVLATETRFIPSTDFLAGYAYDEVKMEVLLVDLAESEYNFEERLDLDYIASQYLRVIPHVDWTYSVSELNWKENAEFVAALEASRIGDTNVYDPRELMNHWDSMYNDLFNESSRRVLILPILLLMTPSDWTFSPDWSGTARPVYGKFGYIYAVRTEAAVNPDSENKLTMPLNGLEIAAGSCFNVSNEVGQIIQLELTIEEVDGTVSAYLLDDYGYAQYRDGLPFNDFFNFTLQNVSESTEEKSASAEISIYGRYHLVLENEGSNAITVDATVTLDSEFSLGYTCCVMHEIGHALGLNHPHDGFSWNNYDHPDAARGIYLNWLWDMSYSQISYAHFAPTISVMDVDTLQREAIPRYWKDAIENMSIISENAIRQYGEVPSDIAANLALASDLYADSVAFYSDTTDLLNYNKSLQAVIQMWDAIHLIDPALSVRTLNPFLIIGIVGIGIVCVVSVALFIMKRRK